MTTKIHYHSNHILYMYATITIVTMTIKYIAMAVT